MLAAHFTLGWLKENKVSITHIVPHLKKRRRKRRNTRSQVFRILLNTLTQQAGEAIFASMDAEVERALKS